MPVAIRLGIGEVQALSVEEARERQNKLAKMRALLFYHELKAKRMKKIKSKARTRPVLVLVLPCKFALRFMCAFYLVALAVHVLGVVGAALQKFHSMPRERSRGA